MTLKEQRQRRLPLLARVASLETRVEALRAKLATEQRRFTRVKGTSERYRIKAKALKQERNNLAKRLARVIAQRDGLEQAIQHDIPVVPFRVTVR